MPCIYIQRRLKFYSDNHELFNKLVSEHQREMQVEFKDKLYDVVKDVSNDLVLSPVHTYVNSMG